MPTQLIDDRLWSDIYTQRHEKRPSDLYLWWAIFSDFRVSKPRNGGFPTTISFIAEGDSVSLLQKFGQTRHHMRIGKPYLLPMGCAPSALSDGTQSKTCGQSEPSPRSSFFTFTINVPPKEGSLRNSADSPDADGVALRRLLLELFVESKLTRLQLGFPRGKIANDDTAGANQIRKEEEVSSRIQADVVMGVVDNGAAFAHGSMRDKTGLGTRLAVVWNQSREQGALSPVFWRKSLQDWYGAVLLRDQMNSAMANNQRWGQVDEIRCYESLMVDRESQRVLNNRDTHGAAVLTCAAGAINPSWMIKSSLDPAELPRARAVDDPASRAPVIFVDLPFETTGVSSGRWMPVAALDAVRFILDEANRRYCKKLGTAESAYEPVPIVINISSGSNAGSHDGNSMFESALTELLYASPTLNVTVATGNARLSGSHAKRIIPTGQTGDLVVRIPAAKRGETYVEFWPEWEDPLVTESLSKYASQLKISLVTPNGTLIEMIGPDAGGALLKDGAGEVVAGLNFVENAVQSVGRPMALLVVAATAPLEPFPHAPYGDWTVRCHNATGRSVRIKAWIERDDIVFGVRRPQLVHFCESGNVEPPGNKWIDDGRADVTRHDTFSNLANAKLAFSVGAALGPREDGYASPYSGGGAVDGSTRPQLMARADRSSARQGMPVFGAFGSARQHMNGTSIAAPQAARWIANYVARGHGRSDVQMLAAHSEPRTHPHLKVDATGLGQVAASEGRWFIDPWDESSELGLGEKK